MEREERPAHGTAQGGPSLLSDKETALYKHVKFFDRDGDGKVGPLDTYRGFRDIGFGILLSLYAAIVIPLAMGWLTNDKWNWWPSVQIKVRNIHKAKHGSDSQMYDHNGNFRAHEFDQLFDSFDLDGDGKLSFLELFRMTESFRYAPPSSSSFVVPHLLLLREASRPVCVLCAACRVACVVRVGWRTTGSGGRRSSSSGAFCSSCAKRTGRSAGRACAASTTVRCSTPSPRGEERRQSSLCRGRCRRRSSRRSGGRRNDEHEE